jgi:hypothetical protein
LVRKFIPVVCILQPEDDGTPYCSERISHRQSCQNPLKLKMKALSFFVFCTTTFQLCAQPETDLCLSGGFNGGRNGFVEIGLAKRTIGDERHYTIGFTGYSVEFKPGNHFIMAPKVGVWGGAMSPLLIGLNLLFYTDFVKGNLVFRPEAGVGLPFFKLVYGYNSALTNKNFAGVNKHNIGLLFILKLKALKVPVPKG